MDNKKLIEHAYDAVKFAYVPYSKFKVGAALLTKSGKIFKGCNIENIAYPATNCAERTAIFKAISEGETDFLKIAIVSESDNPEFSNFAGDFTYPCGICRQVMSEFMLDGEVVLSDKNGNIKTFTVKELLPHSFS